MKSATKGYGKTKQEVYAIIERNLKNKGKLTDHFNRE